MTSLNNAIRSLSECVKCNVRFTFLLLFLVFAYFYANSQTEYKIISPSGDGWVIPSSATDEDQVSIKYSGNKYVQSVKVVPLPMSVAITPMCLPKLVAGETMSLSANVSPNIAANKTVTWSVSGDAVSINAYGTVTAQKTGIATITVTTNKNNKQSSITVEVVSTNNNYVPKPFSVANGKKIYFSKGNLQYNVNDNTWRFANNQWDFVGGDDVRAGNMGCTSNESDGPWIDLFGWGTWTKNGAAPTCTTSVNTDYKTGVESSGAFENVCKGNIGSEWKTLSNDEWHYLLTKRSNATKLCGIASVNGVNGLILLPDQWSDPKPDGKVFKSGGFTLNQGREYFKAANEYNSSQWTQMERSGAVFLPAAGIIKEKVLGWINWEGCYYTDMAEDADHACLMSFAEIGIGFGTGYRCNGCSVRLVRFL